MMSSEERELEVPMSAQTAAIPFGAGGLAPSNFEGVVRACKALSDSRLFTVGKSGPPLSWQQCFARVQMGAEIGLSMMQSMWNIYDVYGRPHVQVEMAWALALRSGEVEDSGEEWSGEGDDFGCLFWAKPKGRRRLERRFTRGDARRAGLIKPDSNWQKWEQRMLYQRAKGFVIKDGFPGALHGLGVAADDEIGFSAARNVTPQREAPAPSPLIQSLAAPPAEIEIPSRAAPVPVDVGRTAELFGDLTEAPCPECGGAERCTEECSLQGCLPA